MTAEPEVLRFEDVRVVLGRREVLRVDELAVHRGEVVVLLGPNGSGKSTLLRTGAFLLRPASGQVALFGEASRGRGVSVAVRRRTASVFSDPSLLDMSVRANVETALRLHGMGRGERRRRAEHWLERLDVLRLAGARPHTLSAGEAQRVALARAFAVEPELLFLDEPFASVDVETRARLVGELRTLLAAQHTTALIATHDRSEAQLLAERVVVLIDGCVEQDGPVEDVLQRPRTLEVAAFLGYGIVESTQLSRVFPMVQPRGALAGIPPDALALAAPGAEGVSTVAVLGIRGAAGRAELVCDLGVPVAVEVPVSYVATGNVSTGDRVPVCIYASRIVWFDRASSPDQPAQWPPANTTS